MIVDFALAVTTAFLLRSEPVLCATETVPIHPQIPLQALDLPKKKTFKTAHPIVYKSAAPVRWTWSSTKKTTKKISDSIIWIGQKSLPYQPFLTLCGAVGSAATPFAAHWSQK